MKIMHRLFNCLDFISAWEAKREYRRFREKELKKFAEHFNKLVNYSIKQGTRFITIKKPDILTIRDFEVLLRELGFSIEERNLTEYKISFRDKIGMPVRIVKLQ